MLANIAPSLHTFFVPQMQQLGLREQPVRYGSLSTIDDERCSGKLWVTGIGDSCLISIHDLTAKHAFTLYEYPDDFTCVGSMSRSTAQATAQCSRLPAHSALLSSNVLSFRQSGGKVGFNLQKGARYTSTSLTFTPRFFAHLEQTYPTEAEAVAKTLATAPANTLPAELEAVLRSLDPRRANLPGADLYFTSKVMEAVSIIMGNTMQQISLEKTTEQDENRKIACEAKALIDASIAEPLTLQAIADRIYVSRTHLCTAFKQETGGSVGEYLRSVRMRHARELLADTQLPISEISRAVGYSRQSSFAEAFKEDAGITPSEWRKLNR